MAGYRRISIEDKIKYAKLAIANQEKGISINKTSKELDISDVSLYSWVKKYQAGTLKENPLDSLVDTIKEDGNGVIDPETKKLKLGFAINEIETVVEIDDPELKNYSEQIKEIKKRVFSQCRIFTEL